MLYYNQGKTISQNRKPKGENTMTNYTFTFIDYNNNTTTFTKSFKSYFSAMNFASDYFAKNNIKYYTMR